MGVKHIQEYAPEVRGVHATKQIKEDEDIVEIPLKCLITVEMGKATEVDEKITNGGKVKMK